MQTLIINVSVFSLFKLNRCVQSLNLVRNKQICLQKAYNLILFRLASVVINKIKASYLEWLILVYVLLSSLSLKQK